MAKKSGLGKGLDSLIPPTKNYDLKADKMVGDDDGSPSEGWIKVKLSKIEPDRNQPRKNFKEDELN
ncbi:MAG: chromosome partitioning protein ParB, partial [Lachnospiraceae bacterium]|nr:chromosome partitioning protein ParB [Lachnospiraceae bacterium]